MTASPSPLPRNATGVGNAEADSNGTPTAKAMNAVVSPRVLCALLLDRTDLAETHWKMLARCIGWRKIPAGDAFLIRGLAKRAGLIAES
jgi:hypothetical protein